MDPVTHCIDPAHVERLITPRTSAIVATHVWGHPCDVDRLEEIAHRHGIAIMYDAAHAFGCSRNGTMIGSNGRCEVFSFHATKFLNSFEGGAIATNDDALAERCRLMRNFGFAGFDNAVDLGTNGKLTEVCAAMGVTCLEAIDELIEANRTRYERYVQELGGIPGLRVFRYDSRERNNFQYIVVEVDPARFGATRDEVVSHLHSHNVMARKYFWPGVHRFEPYRSERALDLVALPVTERVAPSVVVLPTGPQMTPEDVSTVCGLLVDFGDERSGGHVAG
jgi:dTDP-4-amino-4,6-dideoxygalactose transaminase